MFAVGLTIILLWLLLVVSRPLIVKTRLGGFVLVLGAALMVLSIVRLTWIYLP